MKKFLKDNWVLLMILALAIFFRYWQITTMPAGLFPDEAANGLDINNIFHGQIQPFYERGNGREALFFYFLAASVALFGRGPWQHHIISAGFGVASVLAVYFLTKRLFNKKIALLTTFLMAVSSYAVTVSRTAFRANTVPLFSILTLLYAVKFFQSDDKKTKYHSAAFSGLFFALGFYTYTSFRMMLPLLAGFAILLYFGHRAHQKQIYRDYLKYKLAFVGSFLVGIAWLAIYYIHHPKSFVGRAGQVSIFSKELNNGDVLGTFLLVLKKTFLSFFITGDSNWRHNISGQPFLSIFISPFFAIALVLSTIALFKFLKQAWEQKIKAETAYLALVACWFWFMLVPEITTAEGIPHGLRLIGVIPPLFILTAWGMHWIWQKITINHKGWPKQYFAILFFAIVMIYNFYLYFVVAASSPEYYNAFRGDLTVVANYVNQRNLKNRTYLSLDEFWLQTTDYLTSAKNIPYTAVDPAHTYEVKLKKGDQVIFTTTTFYDRIKFLQTHPKAKLVVEGHNQFGLLDMLVYEQE